MTRQTTRLGSARLPSYANHARVLGGDQGIGKDSMLEPVKQAIGLWNFIETSLPKICCIPIFLVSAT